MKGFYFSLDAMLATMILTATMTFLITYTPTQPETDTPEPLKKIDTAQKQKINEWNKSYTSNNTVLQEIIHQHQQESIATANNTCNQYFQIKQPYALYTSPNQKLVCGQNIINNQTSTKTRQVTLADTPPFTQNFTTHQEAILVIKD